MHVEITGYPPVCPAARRGPAAGFRLRQALSAGVASAACIATPST